MRRCFHIPPLLIAGILLLCTAELPAVDKMLFPQASKGTPQPGGNMVLSCGENRLDAFFSKGEAGMPVILYSHGNGETLPMIMPLLKSFCRRGYSVMAYDYSGYGASTGYPGEKQAYKDVEAAYNYLTAQQKIAPANIVVMGFSVGSGPSCYIAEKYPVKAVVIISGFASAAQVLLPFSVPFDKFPNAERLSKSAVPLLIFHGRSDRIVPIRNGEKLLRASVARHKQMHYENAGHNDIFYKTVNFFGKLEKFLATCPAP